MRRSSYAPDMDLSVSVRGVRIALTAAAAFAVAGSGFAFGRATATCTVTVTHVAPGVAPTSTPVPTSLPSTPQDATVAAMTTHTATGAAEAATAMAAIVSGPTVTQADAYRRAVASIAAPSHRDALLNRADQLVAAVDAQLGVVSASAQNAQVTVRTIPVSWHVESYSSTTATVRVWAVGLVAEDGSLPATAVWASGDFDVEWTDAGWRLDDVRTVSGPVPQSQQQPTVTAALPPEVGSFQEYRHVPAP
ncbi:MAG TPA: hypothetical protein VN193_11125 [Candidatus Angelobacter sp.]|jgi:hypothetical protein|nr:hypothetical protein [Candidatus Angelobacter sp.]